MRIYCAVIRIGVRHVNILRNVLLLEARERLSEIETRGHLRGTTGDYGYGPTAQGAQRDASLCSCLMSELSVHMMRFLIVIRKSRQVAWDGVNKYNSSPLGLIPKVLCINKR